MDDFEEASLSAFQQAFAGAEVVEYRLSLSSPAISVDPKSRHGRHLESVTSNRKWDSVNRCDRPICLENIPAGFHPDPI